VYLPDHEVTLERLTAEHADAVLAFELENREYFARGYGTAVTTTSRPSRPFTRPAAEQEAGVCQFHVLVDKSGAVVGRVNLVDVENGRLSSATGSRRRAARVDAAVRRYQLAEYG
jgi:ribosomal-protein-alanine N-acetyltransferase